MITQQTLSLTAEAAEKTSSTKVDEQASSFGRSDDLRQGTR